jgi:FAD/FMN-containing dehydrogenase
MIEDPFELEGLNTDWTYKFKGTSTLAITPRSTDQLSTVMKILNQHRVSVVA